MPKKPEKMKNAGFFSIVDTGQQADYLLMSLETCAPTTTLFLIKARFVFTDLPLVVSFSLSRRYGVTFLPLMSFGIVLIAS